MLSVLVLLVAVVALLLWPDPSPVPVSPPPPPLVVVGPATDSPMCAPDLPGQVPAAPDCWTPDQSSPAPLCDNGAGELINCFESDSR